MHIVRFRLCRQPTWFDSSSFRVRRLVRNVAVFCWLWVILKTIKWQQRSKTLVNNPVWYLDPSRAPNAEKINKNAAIQTLETSERKFSRYNSPWFIIFRFLWPISTNLKTLPCNNFVFLYFFSYFLSFFSCLYIIFVFLSIVGTIFFVLLITFIHS